MEGSGVVRATKKNFNMVSLNANLQGSKDKEKFRKTANKKIELQQSAGSAVGASGSIKLKGSK